MLKQFGAAVGEYGIREQAAGNRVVMFMRVGKNIAANRRRNEVHICLRRRGRKAGRVAPPAQAVRNAAIVAA